jgi:hypothetical protein
MFSLVVHAAAHENRAQKKIAKADEVSPHFE